MPIAIARATAADESHLRKLLQALPVDGWIRLRYGREPDFFAGASVEGRRVDVILARCEPRGEIVGFGTRAEKECFVNGQPTWVGWLGSLRLAPEHRGGILLARGYRFLRQLDATAQAQVYLTTITRDNQLAERVLPSGRAGLPIYRPIGTYIVYALSSRVQLTNLPADPSLTVRAAQSEDVPLVLELLADSASRRQFVPVYTAAELREGSGLLRGFRLNNLQLAWRGNRLVGCLGWWDQKPFKQHIVEGYRGAAGALRWVWNGWAACTRRPKLPPAGEPLNACCLALTSVVADEPTVFQTLLRAVVTDVTATANQRHTRETVLLAGFEARDPLRSAVAKVPHLSHANRLYLVAFDAARLDALRDPLPPYLELGSL